VAPGLERDDEGLRHRRDGDQQHDGHFGFTASDNGAPHATPERKSWGSAEHDLRLARDPHFHHDSFDRTAGESIRSRAHEHASDHRDPDRGTDAGDCDLIGSSARSGSIEAPGHR
jgi:hypothetical protein